MNDVFDLPADATALPVATAAERLGVPVSRVHQHVRDGLLLSFRRGGEVFVPADFLDPDDNILKGLPGTITVLRDGGFTDVDILRWLFAADETLPATPIALLLEGRHREVKRRAQVMGF